MRGWKITSCGKSKNSATLCRAARWQVVLMRPPRRSTRGEVPTEVPCRDVLYPFTCLSVAPSAGAIMCIAVDLCAISLPHPLPLSWSLPSTQHLGWHLAQMNEQVKVWWQLHSGFKWHSQPGHAPPFSYLEHSQKQTLARIWGQVAYLGGDPQKHSERTGK